MAEPKDEKERQIYEQLKVDYKDDKDSLFLIEHWRKDQSNDMSWEDHKGFLDEF